MLLLLCVSYKTLSVDDPNSTSLSIAFPTALIYRDGGYVLDPSNLESTYQYYFLENIVLPLIVDDQLRASGYGPGIAKNWQRTGPKEITFELNSDRRWSNGEVLSAQDIKNSFLVAKAKQHRHLQKLITFTQIDISGDGQKISFKYPAEIDESILHEFTLADSAIVFYDKQLNPVWNKTSGHYSLKTVTAGEIHLVKNNYVNPSEDLTFPHEVIVRSVPFQLTSAAQVDFFAPQAWLFRPQVQELRRHMKFQYEGEPVVIHYFEVLSGDAKIRKEFANGVRAFQKREKRIKLSDDLILNFETQMIPAGYAGRLTSERDTRQTHTADGKASLLLLVDENYNAILPAISGLIANLSDRFIVRTSPENFEHDRGENSLVVKLRPFKGNMKDPRSSWAFLFDPRGGPLARFGAEYLPRLKEIDKTLNLNERSELLRSLHRQVLDDAAIVPFFNESQLFLSNRKINFSRINRFDMRLRFYDFGLI